MKWPVHVKVYTFSATIRKYLLLIQTFQGIDRYNDFDVGSGTTTSQMCPTYILHRYVPGDPVGWNKFIDYICIQLDDFKKAIEEAK